MLRFAIMLITVVQAYHKTDDIIKLVQKECQTVANLNCSMHQDIPIVDWRSDLPRDIVWAFNEHARERITGELALEMILKLKYIQPTRRITILPVVNVWGRKHVEKGHVCQRKNKNGVDTNRNFPQNIKHYYSKNSEEYQGAHPISEKETKLIAKVLQGANKYINIHSGEYSLYMPWDSSYEKPPKYNQMLKKLKKYKKHCKKCTVGPAASTSFYRAYGTSVDYATNMGIEAYTFEIFGKDSYDCDIMFNPRGQTFHNVINMWTKILSMTIDD